MMDVAKYLVLSLCCMPFKSYGTEYYWLNYITGSPWTHFSSAKAACVAAADSEPVFIYGGVNILREDQAHCMDARGFAYRGISRLGDSCAPGLFNDDETGECVNRNDGPPSTCTANPINTLAGYKFQRESDYTGSPSGVSFERTFNGVLDSGQWGYSYQNSLEIDDYTNFLLVTVDRADGRAIRFKGTVATEWLGEADVKERLIAQDDGAGTGTITGWRLVLPNDIFEDYDVNGKLLAIIDRDGRAQILDYNVPAAQGGDDNPETLDRVVDDFGNTLSFAYDVNERLATMTDPEGGVYRYAYDANDMLQYVSYPDDTPGVSGSNPFGEDNPYREYHYEDTNYSAALTGITDETGNRFATWTYDSQGRAISSEHANGTELVTLDYTHIDDATDPRVKVTNELGKDTTYHYATLHGVRKVTQVEGHVSANCAAANQNYTYDANGFLDEITDWEGNVTDYDHDARGLEIQRIEARGTPQERTITTQWHTDYRLPIKITEPDRVIDLTYDASGQLLERKVTPVTP